ncbi:retrovirus-related pol polyprotein from transposon TNT 1-94 [Tanacetum coccineum]|uniref:Retrovirus-related pol polyprotein from transposon TNT 1-94 n=1 Tax=Tanacetum coccineum TaxID=301880 RepID=A0ABQ5ITZ7_9ASTR
MQAIENRFGGNTAIKKTQKNLLKQQYEKFATSNTKVIEQTYERFQKLISQLEMHVTRGDTSAVGLGKRIVLPRSFTGSPRYIMQNYEDAMALFRAYDNPDLVITFTSNLKWPEIAKMLAYFHGQKSHDRPEQRIRLYCKGKDNGENILKSIDEGPFQMGKFHATLAEGNEGALHLDPERDRVFTDLLLEEHERSKADIRATNILLQGFPKDIYTLINHYTDAKDIWDNVKMLLEGSEITKDDHESQLYDEFEHFYQNKGETIHEYYVRFVTAIKLNRGLKESNYDQLYAYLKQHEAHANENKMILERFIQYASDPLTLMSNVTTHQYPSQSSAILQPHQVVIQNVQGRQNRAQRNNARGEVAPRNRGVQNGRVVAPGNGGVQNRVGNATPGQARWRNNAFDDDVDEPPV